MISFLGIQFITTKLLIPDNHVNKLTVKNNYKCVILH